MLSGTPATGSLFMMSFGLPMVPAVALTAFGNAQIAAMGFSLPKARMRSLLGFAVAGVGLANMATPAATLTALCIG
ncbi:hypothetical protein HFN46_04650 [Rhizobium leguminosarum]|nr:hypothetical protein [Rhizobium leguminosarum]